MKKVLTTFALGLSTFAAYAQEKPQATSAPEQTYKFGVGVGAGFTTGYGLSFRYIPRKFGVQVSFAPYKTSETERYSVGATFLYMLSQNKNTNFYLYQGNHYYYNSEIVTVYSPDFPYTESRVRQSEGYMNNGLGFGIEIIIAKRVGLNFMAGYAAYDNFNKLNVTGETGLYYKF